jgi:hypothetical protein
MLRLANPSIQFKRFTIVDFTSLEVLEVLLKGDNISTLVAVGCYRSDEVDETHLLRKMVHDLQHRGNDRTEDDSLKIAEISVGNL